MCVALSRLLIIITVILFAFVGCAQNEPPPPPTTTVSPGPPQHFDVGNAILKNPLPEDMADGFLELGRAPDLNYGVTMVSGRLSARSHTLSDMTIYLHAGSARFNVGSQSYQANTGDMIYIPRGAIYSAYAPDDVKMYMITIYSPPLDANDVEYHERSEGKREGVNISTDIESE